MTNSQTLGSNALPVVAYVYAKIHKEMSLQHMSDDKHSKWGCSSSITSNAQIGFTYINKSNKIKKMTLLWKKQVLLSTWKVVFKMLF